MMIGVAAGMEIIVQTSPPEFIFDFGKTVMGYIALPITFRSSTVFTVEYILATYI
jgi:hypothetical protein